MIKKNTAQSGILYSTIIQIDKGISYFSSKKTRAFYGLWDYRLEKT